MDYSCISGKLPSYNCRKFSSVTTLHVLYSCNELVATTSEGISILACEDEALLAAFSEQNEEYSMGLLWRSQEHLLSWQRF